jgi:uroporphyrinogen decarboxylase
MISRERVLAALRLEQPDRVPWLEAGVDKEIQEQVMRRSDFTPSELAAAIGLDGFCVDFLPPIFARQERRGERSFYMEGLIRTASDLERLEFADPEDPGFYAEAKRIVDLYRGDYAVCARIRLGISPTYLSMGLDGFSFALKDDPALVETILERYAVWTMSVVRHLKDVGVDLVWSMDDLAYKTGPMFSPRVFRGVVLPKVRPVAEAIRSSGLPWIHHSDGNLMLIIEDLLSLGMNALHPIEPGAMMEIGEFKRQYGHRVCLVGNIDLRHTLTHGTPTEVEQEVKERIEVAGRGGGYIISSANTLTSYCKLENIVAMREAIARYGAYCTASRQRADVGTPSQ